MHRAAVHKVSGDLTEKVTSEPTEVTEGDSETDVRGSPSGRGTAKGLVTCTPSVQRLSQVSSRILTAVCAPRHCAVSVLAHAPGICVATCFSHAGACLHFLHGSLEIQTLILMTSTFCHVLLLCFVGFGVLLRNLCLLQGHTYFLDISRSSIVLPFMFIFRWGVTRG